MGPFGIRAALAAALAASAAACGGDVRPEADNAAPSLSSPGEDAFAVDEENCNLEFGLQGACANMELQRVEANGIFSTDGPQKPAVSCKTEQLGVRVSLRPALPSAAPVSLDLFIAQGSFRNGRWNCTDRASDVLVAPGTKEASAPCALRVQLGNAALRVPEAGPSCTASIAIHAGQILGRVWCAELTAGETRYQLAPSTSFRCAL